MSQFLDQHPPPLIYAKANSGTRTKCSIPPRVPDSVVEWTDFYSKVNQYHWDDTPPKYPRWEFREYTVSCEEDVRHAFSENVLRPLETVAQAGMFGRPSRFNKVEGHPDFVYGTSGDEVRLVIEVKTKWSLPVEEGLVVEGWANDQPSYKNTSPGCIYHHVIQMFGYLSANNLRYGVISTYDNTWFLHRPPDKPGELQITSHFQYDSQQPTLFQCLCHLLSLADKEYVCGSPPPPPLYNEEEDSPENDEDDEQYMRNGGRTRTRARLTIKDLNKREKGLGLVMFDWSAFDTHKVLGAGRTGTVFEATLFGEIVALKICDLWQHPDYLEELLNELEVYYALRDLQGICIPTLVDAGYTAGGLFAIATSIAGTPLTDKDVESLSKQERRVIRRALSLIHLHGYVHGDIREDNILIERSGQQFSACFIDFGYSKKGSKRERGAEKRALVRILG